MNNKRNNLTIYRRTYTINVWKSELFDFLLSALLDDNSKFKPYFISIGGGYDLAPSHALFTIIISKKDNSILTQEDLIELTDIKNIAFKGK